MLIRNLRADGFLKFRKIRLNNIPKRGLIGLVGPNESGKSSIGQLIQYALFGTTHKMTRGSIVDLIHWEEDHCIVELDLEHDGEWYRIWREMDRLGTSYARLLRLDPEEMTTGEEVAAGVIQVQKEVFRRFQLGASETLHSFYLAERESVTSPEQFRGFLDRVAGIDVLQGASKKVQVALHDLESVFTENQAEIQRNDTHISRLQPNIDKIPDLEKEIETRESRLGELQQEAGTCHSKVQDSEKQRDEVSKIQKELKSLDQLSSEEVLRKCNGLIGLLQADLAPAPVKNSGEIPVKLQVALEKVVKAHECRLNLDTALDSARSSLEEKLSSDHENSFSREIERQRQSISELNSSHLRHRALSVVTFLAGLLFILVGVDHELEWGFSKLLPLLSGLEQEKGTGFLLAAFGAALFVFTSWLWSKASLDKQNSFDAEGHVARLEMERDVAGASLESTRAHDAHGKPGLDPGEDVTNCRLRGVQDALESLRTQRREIQGELGDLPGETLAQWVQPIIENVRKGLRQDRKKLDEVNESLKRIKSKRDRLASQVREYQNQEGRRKALEEVNDGLRSKSLEVRSEMDVHRLLLELLEETIESVRLRTGPSLGKGLCRLLPHLTGGRYRDAQVTRDFEIKLFTGAKSDFLQSHELSGGTLQGLTFGFRLAFAQAYVRAVTGAPQFLFLDEPFPAMDRDRVLHTLRALPRLSRELSQIFVAHPDLEEEARSCFDHILDTELGSGELSHDFSVTGAQRPRRVTGDLGQPRSLPGTVKEKRTSTRKPSHRSSEKREVSQRQKPEKAEERVEAPTRVGTSHRESGSADESRPRDQRSRSRRRSASQRSNEGSGEKKPREKSRDRGRQAERPSANPGFSDLPDPVGKSPEKPVKRDPSPKQEADKQEKTFPKEPGFADLPDPVGKSPTKPVKKDDSPKHGTHREAPFAPQKNPDGNPESRESENRPAKPTHEKKPEKDRPRVDAPDKNTRSDSTGFNPDDWVIP